MYAVTYDVPGIGTTGTGPFECRSHTVVQLFCTVGETRVHGQLVLQALGALAKNFSEFVHVLGTLQG